MRSGKKHVSHFRCLQCRRRATPESVCGGFCGRETFHLPDDLTAEEKLEPVTNLKDDPRIRLLNRLYARKRRDLQEKKLLPAAADPAAAMPGVIQDGRSVEELLSFIGGDAKEGEKAKSKKKRSKKKGCREAQPGAATAPEDRCATPCAPAHARSLHCRCTAGATKYESEARNGSLTLGAFCLRVNGSAEASTGAEDGAAEAGGMAPLRGVSSDEDAEDGEGSPEPVRLADVHGAQRASGEADEVAAGAERRLQQGENERRSAGVQSTQRARLPGEGQAPPATVLPEPGSDGGAARDGAEGGAGVAGCARLAGEGSDEDAGVCGESMNAALLALLDREVDGRSSSTQAPSQPRPDDHSGRAGSERGQPPDGAVQRGEGGVGRERRVPSGEVKARSRLIPFGLLSQA